MRAGSRSLQRSFLVGQIHRCRASVFFPAKQLHLLGMLMICSSAQMVPSQLLPVHSPGLPRACTCPMGQHRPQCWRRGVVYLEKDGRGLPRSLAVGPWTAAASSLPRTWRSACTCSCPCHTAIHWSSGPAAPGGMETSAAAGVTEGRLLCLVIRLKSQRGRGERAPKGK